MRKANEGWSLVYTCGSDALLCDLSNAETPYVAAAGYDPGTNSWQHGSYRKTLLEAYNAMPGNHAIDMNDADIVGWSVFTHEDVRDRLKDVGMNPTDDLVEEVADKAYGPMCDMMCARGWDVLCGAVDEVLSGREDEEEGRVCDRCLDGMAEGFRDDEDDRYLCKACMEAAVEKGEFRPGGEEENVVGGYYEERDPETGEWLPCGFYWTEWEGGAA